MALANQRLDSMPEYSAAHWRFPPFPPQLVIYYYLRILKTLYHSVAPLRRLLTRLAPLLRVGMGSRLRVGLSRWC